MIINGVDFGLGADAVLRNNARDMLAPSGWGALAPADGAVASGTLQPASDVMVTDAPDRAGNYGTLNVFPAGEVPPTFTPEQAAYVKSRSTMWAVIGTLAGAVVGTGVCLAICRK